MTGKKTCVCEKKKEKADLLDHNIIVLLLEAEEEKTLLPAQLQMMMMGHGGLDIWRRLGHDSSVVVIYYLWCVFE